MALWKIKCGTNRENTFKLDYGIKNPKFLWKLEIGIKKKTLNLFSPQRAGEPSENTSKNADEPPTTLTMPRILTRTAAGEYFFNAQQ